MQKARYIHGISVPYENALRPPQAGHGFFYKSEAGRFGLYFLSLSMEEMTLQPISFPREGKAGIRLGMNQTPETQYKQERDHQIVCWQNPAAHFLFICTWLWLYVCYNCRSGHWEHAKPKGIYCLAPHSRKPADSWHSHSSDTTFTRPECPRKSREKS